jgi:hypothetical protein
VTTHISEDDGDTKEGGEQEHDRAKGCELEVIIKSESPADSDAVDTVVDLKLSECMALPAAEFVKAHDLPFSSIPMIRPLRKCCRTNG